jgi:hypothetical protein
VTVEYRLLGTLAVTIDAAAVAVTRADALEPPGNANTTRLLEILVGEPVNARQA